MPRGFQTLSPERRKEISSKGGKAAHAAGTAHEFSSDEARVAGQKGGKATHAKRGGPRKPVLALGDAAPTIPAEPPSEAIEAVEAQTIDAGCQFDGGEAANG